MTGMEGKTGEHNARGRGAAGRGSAGRQGRRDVPISHRVRPRSREARCQGPMAGQGHSGGGAWFLDPTYVCPPSSYLNSSSNLSTPSVFTVVGYQLMCPVLPGLTLSVSPLAVRKWGIREGLLYAQDPGPTIPASGHRRPLTSLASHPSCAERDCQCPGPQVLTLGLYAALLAHVNCVYTSGGSTWGLFDVGDGEGQFPLCVPGNHRLLCQRAITPVGEISFSEVAHKEGLACV